MSDDLTIAYMLGAEDMRSKLHKQADEIERLRAENEKLRAATGSLVRSLSGCWYAFEPSLRREMGNTNYHCVKEKMDEVEALLDLRAAAAAIRESGE
jgi:hypothetical protein